MAGSAHNRHPLAWYLMWAVALVVSPLPLVLSLNSGLTDAPARILITDLGVIAYSWWLVDIYLSTRPSWLDRRVGLPSLYFLHGSIGVLSLLAATGHVLWSFSFHQSVRQVGRIAWYVLIGVVVLAVLFLTGWIVDRSRSAAKAKRVVGKALPHQANIWLHRLVFVLVGLIVAHVLLIPRVSRNLPFMVLFALETLTALGFYAWHLFIAPSLPSHQALVVANRALNGHTRQLTLRLDAGDSQARPGDFYFVSFQGLSSGPKETRLSGEAHPFSVTAIRQEPVQGSSGSQASQLVDLTIANEGDFTSRVDTVPVGTPVSLEGPFGRFEEIVERNPGRPLVLIGMGAGVAPMLGLAQAHPERRILVADVVSRPDDLYYRADFEALASQRGPQRASGVPNVQGAPAAQVQPLTFIAREHRIDRNWVAANIPQDLIGEALFIVVGPAAGVLSVRRLLHGCGVPRDRIVDERLTM